MKVQDQTLTRPAAAVAEPAKPTEIALAFDDNGLASIVFGHYDQNIARIERRLGVSANANGNQIVIRGPREASRIGAMTSVEIVGLGVNTLIGRIVAPASYAEVQIA